MAKSDKTADDLLRQLFTLKLPIVFDPAPTEDDGTLPGGDAAPPSGAAHGQESGKQVEPPAARTGP